MTRILAAVVVLVCWIMVIQESALACECDYPPPPEVWFEQSDLVFLGTVISGEVSRGEGLVTGTIEFEVHTV